VFSNRASEGDFMYEGAESRDDDWWDRQLKSFIEALEEEAGIIAFTVDFKGLGLPQFFVRVLNWKDWPEELL
jgi:nucleosome binding factor SPN SPT16 subunit